MALPAALSGPWNPLRISGTAMPPALLLMCKILAVAVLATNHVRILPAPFLPFIEALDLVDGAFFQAALYWTAVISALALLFNRTVRASALVLGSCMLLAVVSSKAYYGNNKTFVGLCLVLAGLSDFDRPAYLLRWQLSLTYFGAALNKLLDPDWQTGLFFDYWATEKLKSPAFLWLAPQLPTLLAGQIVCWVTVIAEFLAALGLLVPRLVPIALWTNVLFQVGLLEFTGGTFTLFFYAMNAATLAFVTWPRQLVVVYDERRRGHRWLRLALRWLDFDGVQDWQVSPDKERPVRLTVTADDGTVLHGFAAVQKLMLYSPVVWLLLTVVLARIPTATWGRALVALVVMFFASRLFRRL